MELENKSFEENERLIFLNISYVSTRLSIR